jgi:multiple sugar transport system ATP-binding protein
MIELRHIAKRYDGGRVTALSDVSLVVPRGEFLTIVGPSGSGKSTLLHVIAGLLPADRGDVVIDGKIVTAEPTRSRGVAMVLQNLGLYPHLSVIENVAYPLRVQRVPRKEREQHVSRLLRDLGLDSLSHRMPADLSGGERQRVAIGRALARGARALLLDEPFSDLDAALRLTLRRELKMLHASYGLTTLFVTHDQDEALAVGDRVAVMHAGDIVQVASPETVYATPVSAFVARFIGAPPMNMFRVVHDGAALRNADNGEPLPIAVELPADGRLRGTLGIRAEHLRMTAGGPWRITLLERFGRDTMAHLQCGTLNCVAIVPLGFTPDDGVSLRAAGRVHAFDENDAAVWHGDVR